MTVAGATTNGRIRYIQTQMSKSELRKMLEAVSGGDKEEVMLIALEESKEAQEIAEENRAMIQDMRGRIEDIHERIGPAMDMVKTVTSYAGVLKWGGGAAAGVVSIVGLRQAIAVVRDIFIWLSKVV